MRYAEGRATMAVRRVAGRGDQGLGLILRFHHGDHETLRAEIEAATKHL